MSHLRPERNRPELRWSAQRRSPASAAPLRSQFLRWRLPLMCDDRVDTTRSDPAGHLGRRPGPSLRAALFKRRRVRRRRGPAPPAPARGEAEGQDQGGGCCARGAYGALTKIFPGPPRLRGARAPDWCKHTPPACRRSSTHSGQRSTREAEPWRCALIECMCSWLSGAWSLAAPP